MPRLTDDQINRAKSLTDTLIDKGAPHLPLPLFYSVEIKRGIGSTLFQAMVTIEGSSAGISGYGSTSGSLDVPGADTTRGTAWGKLSQAIFPKVVEAAKIAFLDMLAKEFVAEFGMVRGR